MSAKIIKNKFIIKKGKTSLYIKSFEVKHGMIKSTAYVFDKIAYISDCSGIYKRFKIS